MTDQQLTEQVKAEMAVHGIVGLTHRQDEALRFLCAYRDQHGTSPTFVEIRDALNVRNISNVARLMDALEERRFIRRLPHRARAIEILIEPPMPVPITAETLSPQLLVRLYAFCRRHGEEPMAVLSDALVLHMDAIESENRGFDA